VYSSQVFILIDNIEKYILYVSGFGVFFFQGGWQKIYYFLYVKEAFVRKSANKLDVLALFTLLLLFIVINSYGKQPSLVYIRAYTNLDSIPYFNLDEDEQKAFLKKTKNNLAKSIPIAEYCIVYEEKEFCNYPDTCDMIPSYYSCGKYYDSTNVYLRFEKVLQEQPAITICGAYCSDGYDSDFGWANKFIIHDDLKTERCRGFYDLQGSISGGSHSKISYCSKQAPWHFYEEVPIYAKDTIPANSKKYIKYYEKGKIIPVEWKLYAKCNSSKTTYSGLYFIRITGECK
jgi:hypothetical protein